MNKIIQFFALASIIVLTACNSETSVSGPEIISIDLDDHERDLLKVEIVDVIPLETSKECLIGFLGQVKLFDDKIYVLNNLRFKQPDLFVFDQKGNFINKTIHGKGPGEVNEPFAFALNEEDSTILLHDQATGYNIIYDLELNFIRTMKHDRLMIMDLFHLKGSSYLVYNFSVNREYQGPGYEYVNFHIYSDDFSTHKPMGINLYGDKTPTVFVSQFSRWENDILFTAPYNHNIYQIVGDSIQTRYQIDFGKYGFTPDELRELPAMEMFTRTREGRKIGSIYVLLRTRDFMVFTTSFEGKPLTFLRSNKKKEIFCLNDSLDEELISLFRIKGVTDDGVFYSTSEASTLLEMKNLPGELKGLNIHENDNPYLIKFKITK